MYELKLSNNQFCCLVSEMHTHIYFKARNDIQYKIRKEIFITNTEILLDE